jgi:hypothetical protein
MDDMKKLKALSLIFLSIFIFSCYSSPLEVKSDNDQKGPDSSNPEQVYLSGIIRKVIKFEGTLSEYAYFILKYDSKEIIIFNSKQKSNGFDFYVEKKVDISGLETTGTLGWKKTPAPGIEVLDISIVEDL